MDFLTDLQPFFNWLQANPAWAGVMVFIVAMAESLLVIGMLVPGAFIMLSFGALIGTGFLGLWETLLWAFLGAVVGDAISFWIGYYFKDLVPNLWPFKNRKHLLENGKVFFARHGGKSVVLGRFVGPLRAVVPTIAGMMQMRPEKFFLYNVVSAAGWAPAYLLPGVAFGASLGLASEIATRLGILFVVIIVLLVAILWLVKKLSKLLGSKLDGWVLRLIRWGRTRPVMKMIVVNLVDSEKKPQGALFFWFAVLLMSFSVLLSQIIFHRTPLIVSINSYVSQFFSAIHFPWLDYFFSVFYQLGNPVFLGVVFLMALISFVGFKLMQAFWYLLFASIASVLMFLAAEYFLAVKLMHVLLVSTLLGVLSALIGGEFSKSVRRLFYSIASVLVFIISFSALYYGDVSFSTWVFGLSFSFFMIVIMGLSYRRHAYNLPSRTYLGLASLGLVMVFSVGIISGFLQDEYRSSERSNLKTVKLEQWWNGGWCDVYNDKRQNHFPITFQWAASADEIRQVLQLTNWEESVNFTFSSFLRWFSATTKMSELAPLPKIYAGKFESLQLTKKLLLDEERYIIRLWPVAKLENEDAERVWVGNISKQRLRSIGRFARFPYTVKDDVKIGDLIDENGALLQKKRVCLEGGTKTAEVLLLSK